MPGKMLCCGILRRELEHVLQDKQVEIHYLDPGLHVDFNKLEKALTRVLDGMKGDSVAVVIGLQCHPEMGRLVAERGGRVVRAKNSIEMLLGERLAELDETLRSCWRPFPKEPKPHARSAFEDDRR